MVKEINHLSLFNQSSRDNILHRDGFANYKPNLLKPTEASGHFSKLLTEISWRADNIMIFGKSIAQPRLIAWHGSSDLRYSYSGLELKAEPWTPNLLKIKTRVENACGQKFNSVLLNLYRDQKDSNGWHADDEKELGSDPTIASLSLGAPRDFLLKHNTDKKRIKICLESGSLLIMSGKTQHHWKHSLPKRAGTIGPRINLTFRTIMTSSSSNSRA